MTDDELKRFWAKVEKTDGCWNWTGARSSRGYGAMRAGTDHATHGAHRLSFEHFNGPVTDGLQVCHRCDNQRCVRPDHLFLGTNLDNAQDRQRKGRYAAGDQHWSHERPELVPRGDQHWSRRTPELTQRGEKHGGAILTETQVREIRAAKRDGISTRELMKRFGMSKSTIEKIVSRSLWKHVSD